MLALPKELALLERFAVAFTRPTYQRFLFLCLAAIVTMGRRTVSRLLWSARCISDGHPSSYHRFFSVAHWSLWALGRVLAAMVLELVPKDQAVVVEFDDTVLEHRGRKVFANGWHRDAVHSSHGHTRFLLGHRWVVLAVNVKLPLCARCWALPVLVALYVSQPIQPADAAGQVRQNGRRRRQHAPRVASKLPVLRKRNDSGVLPPRHKTPCLLARQLLAALIHWFPERRFIAVGDRGFASHELGWFCYRHRKHVTLVARYIPDATLYTLPGAARVGRGRHPRKGALLACPKETVAAARTRRKATVHWYGGGVRDVELVSGCGGWYRARGSGRAALLPLRWVWAKELAKGQEAWFYSTDPTLLPEQIVGLFAGRWAIEATFQEVRAHLGLQTTRQRCRASVLRATPCLLGLFSLVSVIYAELARRQRVKVHGTPCYAKSEPTFADALAAVRRVIWTRIILPRSAGAPRAAKWPPKLTEWILEHLTAAA